MAAGLGNVMFAEGIRALTTGQVDFDTDTIKAILMRASFENTSLTETAKDTWNFMASLPAADRADVTGGGDLIKVIGTTDVVINTTNDMVNHAPGTVSLTFLSVSSGVNCHGIAIFKSATTEAVSELLCYNDFTTTVQGDGGTITVTLNADGLFRCSY